MTDAVPTTLRPVRPPDGPADLLVTGASVRTLDRAGTVAEALAVTDGRIAAGGTPDALLPFVGRRTRVLQLRGETVLPGFHDAHVHPPTGGRHLLECNLHDLPWERDAYLRRIGEYARAHPSEAWIVGGGWAMPAFPGGTPSRLDLDAIVPDRPVYLENRDAHGGWANSAALALAAAVALATLLGMCGVRAGDGRPAGARAGMQTMQSRDRRLPAGAAVDATFDLAHAQALAQLQRAGVPPGEACGLQALAVAMHTDGSPQFHRFLTPAEYHQRFDPAAATVAGLSGDGLSGEALSSDSSTGVPGAASTASVCRALGVTTSTTSTAGSAMKASSAV